MKSSKKFATVALAGVMALGVFTACGSETADLTDKLNGAGYDFTYSYENSQAATAVYNVYNQLAQVNKDWEEDIKDILDDYSKNYDDLDDDEKQDYLGADIHGMKKYMNAIDQWPFDVKVDLDGDGVAEATTFKAAMEAGKEEEWFAAYRKTEEDHVYTAFSATEMKDLKSADYVDMAKDAVNGNLAPLPVKGVFGYAKSTVSDTFIECYGLDPETETVLVCVVTK